MKINWITGVQKWAYNNLVSHLINAIKTEEHKKNDTSPADINVLVTVSQLKNHKASKKTILHIDGNRWYENESINHDKIIIICGGESLKGFDFSQLNAFSGTIITVNRVIDYLPRADYWITIDAIKEWWVDIVKKHPETCCFIGLPSDRMESYKNIPVNILLRVPYFATNQNEISGGNSGLAALNLAYHFNPSKILILGLDAHGTGHWYPDDGFPFISTNPKCIQDVSNIPNLFARYVEFFKQKNIEVINASLTSKVDCFPKYNFKDALKWIGA